MPEPDTARSRPVLTGATRIMWRVSLVVMALAIVVLALAIAFRERIASDLIDRELRRRGVEGSYRVETIGTDRQVISDLVIGDPAGPDLRIDRLELRTSLGLLSQQVTGIAAQGVRLRGRLADGRLRFGALDPLIYTGSDEPFALPDMPVTLHDAQVSIASDYGQVSAALAGTGNLRDGFAGRLTARSTLLAGAGCRVRRPSFGGTLRTSDGRIGLDGAVRHAALDCAEMGAGAKSGRVAVKALLGEALDSAALDLAGRFRSVAARPARARALTVRAELAIDRDGVTGPVRIGAGEVALAGADATIGALGMAGGLDWQAQPADWRWRGAVRAQSLDLGSAPGALLRTARESLAQTPLGPLLEQVTPRLASIARDADLLADLSLRSNERGLALASALLRVDQRGGAPVLLARDLAWSGDSASGSARLVASGLPALSVDARRAAGGGIAATVQMPRFAADGAALALPRLAVAVAPDGSGSASGPLLLDGPLPGGRVAGLRMPLALRWARSGIRLGEQCTAIGFDELVIATLRLAGQSLTLCPPPGGALLASGARGVQLAAGVAGLDASGTLGGTPLRIRSGAVGLAIPGVLAARNLDLALGPAQRTTRIGLERLDATFGQQVTGRFAELVASIGGVPLRIDQAAGSWRIAGDALQVQADRLRVSDTELPARFVPLPGEQVRLALSDGVITAEGRLLDPRGGRLVNTVAIRHRLADARGEAVLDVPDLAFGPALQPDELTPLALGVVANVQGRVSGQGTIRWSPAGVESGGSFATEGLDLAAAFGPVTGLTGRIRFSDLLGLVTDGEQVARVAQINPGVPVEQGVIRYALLPGLRMRVTDGRWPFAGGTLVLEPATLALGDDSARHLTVRIEGLEAARFLQRLEFENLNATGVFDGRLPLVFDQDGGRIESGVLVARPGGGNIAYVGDLSYRDLSAMGNFAFESLRSLDYRELTLQLDGAIDGEIVTRIRFAGVQQGAGAKRSLISRSIAGLPIQFNINIRAPFYQLLTSTRSLYDDRYIVDPRSLGLIDAEGQPVAPAPEGNGVIQPPESGKEQ